MGIDKVRSLLIDSLIKHNFTHFTERNDILIKNLLYSGRVDVSFVLNIIENCEEQHYSTKYSWDADDGFSHIFINYGWYIKFNLIDGIVNIISVHEDERND